eukprot:TRINITY_DN10143_c0_g2_i1.p1 TRINITY_DN10143_c0_g2~~TRINITY_DN10143_c0_g2_i1.p1  ORF type:complete len:207 (-),score=28.59 TRINITY_DN10143_c0_g2_i1:430-1050(-)
MSVLDVESKDQVLQLDSPVVQNMDHVPREADEHAEPSSWCVGVRLGYLMALLNVMLDVGGSALTRHYGARLDTWDINTIRFGFAALVLGAISAAGHTLKSLDRNDNGEPQLGGRWFEMPSLSWGCWIQVSVGVGLVTYICPALSTYALFKLDLAVTLTLTSTGPVFALPLTYLIKGEPVGGKAVIGSVAAIVGVVVLCFGEDWLDS